MKKDAKYYIVEDIHVEATGDTIKKGGELYRTHGCYYFNGGLVSEFYQKQFDMLTEYEEENGYKYLRKVY